MNDLERVEASIRWLSDFHGRVLIGFVFDREAKTAEAWGTSAPVKLVAISAAGQMTIGMGDTIALAVDQAVDSAFDSLKQEMAELSTKREVARFQYVVAKKNLRGTP